MCGEGCVCLQENSVLEADGTERIQASVTGSISVWSSSIFLWYVGQKSNY